ncbi:hypothetical protein GCM10007984_28320 [Shewanella putrefaciens]|nr:hypothetical protein GCM10007984_28320 [Shewanella putrefaciens]
MGLSTGMEVTVRDMDVTVEHTRTYLLRVTGMALLNHFIGIYKISISAQHYCRNDEKTDC